MKDSTPRPGSLPGFLEGVGVALAGALAASGLVFGFAGVLALPLVLKGAIAALGLAYVLYLLARSRVRIGRISAIAVWLIVTAGTFAATSSLLAHLCVQVGLVWLLRAFFLHRGVLPAIADLGLCTVSITAAIVTAERTGSVFLAVWSLLLVQAAHVVIPRRRSTPRAATGTTARPADDDRFARAQSTAESALRRLSAAR